MSSQTRSSSAFFCTHTGLHLLLCCPGAVGGSDGRYLLDETAWQQIECAGGCLDLVDQLSALLALRNGLWTILFIESAEHAPASQLATVVSRFWRQARCMHVSARERIHTDCRRTIIVLSTAWGSEEIDTHLHADVGNKYVDGQAAGSGDGRLRRLALLDASGWIRHTLRLHYVA